MPIETKELAGILGLATAELAAGLMFVALHNVRARARVGVPKARTSGARRARLVLIGVQIVAAIAIMCCGRALAAAALPLLATAGLLALVMPLAGDDEVGTTGARSGWTARAFSQFEEWRLAGEHLRWRARGMWFAAALPLEFHEDVRARLNEAAPGLETAHGVAGHDPERRAIASVPESAP